MNLLQKTWARYLDRQHQSPHGLIGRVIGERMVRQHAPETGWSLELLRLKANDRILELGFGAGKAMALAIPAIPQGQIVGLDLSSTMLRAASIRNRAAIRRGQAALIRGTLAEPPFAGQHFDKIFSIHTFYFWPNPELLCKQFTQLLAPGGRLVSTLATAQRQADGSWGYWDVHQRALAVVEECGRQPGITATLEYGPDSRSYNNVAIVVDRLA